MPDWKTHFILALFIVIAWLFIFQFLGFEIHVLELVTLITFSLFSSLFPDIDMKRSKIRDTVSFLVSATVSLVYVFLFAETWYYGPIYFALLYLILKYIPSKHRGITHSFKFSVLFSIVLALLYSAFQGFSFVDVVEPLIWFSIVFSSYSIHLIVDKM